MEYVVVIHPAEEGGYWAEVPALDGCFAQGETVEEVLAEVRDAAASHLEALRAFGDQPPRAARPLITTVQVAEPSAA